LPHRAHVVSSGLTEVCEAGQVPCCLKAGARPRYYGAFCPLLSAGRRPSSLRRALPAWPLGQSGACHPKGGQARLWNKRILGMRTYLPTTLTTQWGVLQQRRLAGCCCPRLGCRMAGRFLARCPAAGNRQEQEGLQTRQDDEKKLVFFELWARIARSGMAHRVQSREEVRM
jgi:hypothetical protein